MTMEPCPVPGCERRHNVRYLMCRPCWWRVSKATRAEVYATVNALDSVGLAQYDLACETAIAEAVASRQRSAARIEPWQVGTDHR